MTSKDAQGIMAYGYIWGLDSFLLPINELLKHIPILNIPFFIFGPLSDIIFGFGVLGTISWFFIPILVTKLYKIILRKLKKTYVAIAILVIIISSLYFISSPVNNLVNALVALMEGENPGCKVNSISLSKSLFLEDKRLGTITDIVKIESDKDGKFEIGISGSQGALFADRNANIKSSVIFNAQATYSNIIDVDGDKIYEYLNRGGLGWNSSSLIDSNGRTFWTYGKDKMEAVDDMCSGDINGDGILEFAVGLNGRDGILLLDKEGKIIWRQPDVNVWHVEMADTTGDGSLEIVHGNNDGNIVIRDKEGRIIVQNKSASHLSDFSICNWPTKKDRQYILTSDYETISIIDFNGKTVAEFKAPKCYGGGYSTGVPVKIKIDQPEYFAVVTEYTVAKKYILYIYDSRRALVYQEIFPEDCASIAAIALDNSDLETLLVGGTGKVWQYKVSNTDKEK
jgi:hypothetical protein